MKLMIFRTCYSFIAVLAALFVATGCTPVILPPGMVRASLPSNIEDPDKYLVNSADYPAFRVRQQFDPPKRKVGAVESEFVMVTIEPTDIWKVTHAVGETYLIYSEAYNDRQCRYLARIAPSGYAGGFISRWGGSTCQASHLYHIAITPDGTVRGGWKLLYNPKRFLLARDRYINMQIDPATPANWGPQPLFEPTR